MGYEYESGFEYTVNGIDIEGKGHTNSLFSLARYAKEKGKGGYIFLSHSHLDIDNVRKLRNALEGRGFDALCFYLKCLDDDCEIDGLIKREIDSRGVFLYVESDNSEKSKWVKEERRYIENSSEKIIRKVSLNSIIDNPDAVAEKLVKCQTVFLSCALEGFLIRNNLFEYLIERDYRVIPYSSLGGVRTSEERLLRYYYAMTPDAALGANAEGALILIITEDVDYAVITEILSAENNRQFKATVTVIDSMVLVPSDIMELLCTKTEVVLIDGKEDTTGIKRVADTITSVLNRKYSSDEE